jgi:photosystem II stability/assembly factor-like uncharacterized protein
MKKLISTITAFLLFFQFAQSQWIVQNSGLTSNLYDIEFINRYTGWALGDGGKIIKTTNGGINWIDLPNPSINGGGILSSIFPVDSLYCYVAGGHNIILKTTNGGLSWIEISNGIPSSGIFNGVHFINRTTGWFCGSKRVIRTTNGGLSFDTSITISFNSDIYFRNFDEGLYCTAGKVYKTTNSGMNWFDTNLPFNNVWYEFRKLSVVNNQYVYVIAGQSPLYRSTDFCSNWQVLDTLHSYPPSVMQAVAFSSINTGYVGGSYGYLYKTTNGGLNFYRQNTGSDQRFWGSIYCFNDSVIWGVGGAGKIMHTTTGGQWLVGINNIGGEIPTKYNLYQNYPNPFNPTTTIRFEVCKSNNGLNEELIKISVYDIMGREVALLVNEAFQPGAYEVIFDGTTFSSGVYFYTLLKGNYKETKKMFLMK